MVFLRRSRLTLLGTNPPANTTTLQMEYTIYIPRRIVSFVEDIFANATATYLGRTLFVFQISRGWTKMRQAFIRSDVQEIQSDFCVIGVVLPFEDEVHCPCCSSFTQYDSPETNRYVQN